MAPDKKGQGDQKKKGFAGLSGMVSDVDDIVTRTQEASPALPEETELGAIDQKSEPPPKAEQDEGQRVYQQPNTAPSGGNSGKNWLIGIAVVIGFLWMIGQSNNKVATPARNSQPSVQSPPSPAPIAVQPTPYSAPPASRPAPTGPWEKKPPVGKENVLDLPQLRYCFAESIRIEAARGALDTEIGADVDRFNGIVNDYNRRCGEYRYNGNTLEEAKVDVEARRVALESSGRGRFARRTPQAPTEVSTDSSTVVETQKPVTETVATETEEDKYLQELTAAVPDWQIVVKDPSFAQFLTQVDNSTGKTFRALLGEAHSRFDTQGVSAFFAAYRSWSQQASQAPRERQERSDSSSEFFTRGSNQDDVLRVQGRPSQILDYAALGYEEWRYGNSSVEILVSNRRVKAWNNTGNLKVRSVIGRNATSTDYFTRGSHEDDVLRLQGTPSQILDYAALGYEEWRYGNSSVEILVSSRCVKAWKDQGNLKVRSVIGNNATTADYFTQGSHQDDVMRLQGTPSEILDYAALGYEEWRYGKSSVEIMVSNRRVKAWKNTGNLKVRSVIGRNATSTGYFTRGSHQDDVLRLQGTPSEILDYAALGYEEWRYGNSSVEISVSDRRVKAWDDRGNLRAR